MTLEEKIKSFYEYWGEKAVSPVHCPKMFEYQVKLWKYYLGIN